jgi:hypothetical protein
MWGPPTWHYLHSLGEVIHPEHYLSVKVQLWRCVVDLCSSVPCPDCSSHAASYLSKLPVPPTKEDFRGALWTFHNHVNQKTSKPFFPREKLVLFRVPLGLTFPRCKHAIKQQPYNPMLMIHKMKTKRAVDAMEQWLKQNRLM